MANNGISRASSQLDGRWISGGFAFVVFCLLFAAPHHPPLLDFWKAYGVDHVSPAFVDLRGVTTAPDAIRRGIDPLAENPLDPLHRALNYPRAWTLLRHLGVSEAHTLPLGFCLAAGFLVFALGLVGPLTWPQGIFYGALVCSPAVLFAVERGNIDVLLFCLLTLAATSVTRRAMHLWAYGLVFLCAILKLFPVFGFALALRERRRTGLLVLSAAAIAFAAYLLITWRDVVAMSSNTPQGIYVSYGRKVLFERLRDYGLPLDPNACSLALLVLVVAAAATLCTRVRLPEFTGGAMEKMLIGAGIYGGSFTLVSSFNYRLIFLLFVVPQLLHWLRQRTAARRFAFASLVSVSLALFLSAQLRSWLFLLKESANWIVFGGATFVLFQAALPWLRRHAGDQFRSNARSAAGSFTGA